MIKTKYPKIEVPLIGEDGNIFAIMARVRNYMRRADVPDEEIEAFTEDITSSEDYDQALGKVFNWVSIK